MSAYPAPIRRDYALSDGMISGVHFGHIDNPLKIVFLHANGFNAYAYKTIFEALDVHAVALDLRGHGFTQLPQNIKTLKSFQIFADDAVEFFTRYIDPSVILAGHSFGAVSAIMAAPKIREKLNGYVGFDPVTLPWLARKSLSLPGARAYTKKRFILARKAGQRKSQFQSTEMAFAHYKGRGVFRTAPDAILRDYLSGGLQPDGAGGYRLCCAPKWEQAIYVAQNHNLYKGVADLPDNSHIIYAGKFSAVSTPASRRAVQKRQPKISVQFDETLEHLFPLQQPDIAIAAFKQALARASL